MISRRSFTLGASTSLALAASGCTTHQTGPAVGISDITPGYRPAADTDEAGLWMMVEKAERSTKTAGNRLTDPGMNALLTDMNCRLADKHCPDVRPYLLRVPAFNASAYPNGMIHVWSGLLLRVKNESQLAAVLGHEFAHYRRRHSLQRLRDLRTTADVSAFLSLGLGAVGGGAASLMVAVGASASVAAFSRDNEREADSLGLEIMADAGYDPFEAAEVWRRLNLELKAGGDDGPMLFLATHPDPGEREATLQRLAEKRGRPRDPAPDRLREAIAPMRGMLLADEVARGKFEQSMALFGLLEGDGWNLGELAYAKGELHRRRGKTGDEDTALGLYRQACDAQAPVPEAFRQSGLILWRRGDKAAARPLFTRYLDLAPDAGDREMIKSYLAGA